MLFEMHELDVPYTFSRKPSSLPPDLRPEWRLPLLLLILHKCCRQYKASLTKLHVLNWSIRTPETMNKFASFINGKINPDDVLIRYEPVLNRVLDLAIGEKLVTIVSGNRVQLSPKGIRVAEEINKFEECLKIERKFLDYLSTSITEARLQELVEAVVAL